MTVIHRLDPPIPLTTPKGDAKAFLYIDRGREEFGEWVTFILATGESWTFLDPDVRLWECATDGRNAISPFRRHDVQPANHAREPRAKL